MRQRQPEVPHLEREVRHHHHKQEAQEPCHRSEPELKFVPELEVQEPAERRFQ